MKKIGLYRDTLDGLVMETFLKSCHSGLNANVWGVNLAHKAQSFPGKETSQCKVPDVGQAWPVAEAARGQHCWNGVSQRKTNKR